MTSTDLFFLGFSLFIATVSFIGLLRIDYWWIRMWDFPHFQLMVLASSALIVWLIVSHNFSWPQLVAPVLLVTALFYQAWLMYPYTYFHRVQVPQHKKADKSTENTIRLLIANVFMENTHCPDVCMLVKKHKPDVLLVLEGNETWRKALTEIDDDYPHQKLIPLENTYGMLFYSRFTTRQTRVHYRIQEGIPSITTQLQLPSGQWVNFYGVHPMPPSPTENIRSTERDAELLLVGRDAHQQKGPVIVAGDLNDVAWSHTTRLFSRISGLLDPRIGRGLFSTFHAHYFFLRWPLDHVFVSHHFALNGIKRLPNCGSDHFPILVSLTYTPDPDRADDIPQPEEEDIEEMHEKLADTTSD
ncbi:MAG: endonuclease/exonuclease/phosphatase family protein [Rudanella sp.]|nr:endonuclease/exonuclease/phosphatase family protein [Rudanella sp.]